MKKDGKADSTAETALTRLTRLNKLCDITNPEQVKETLATLAWKNSTKQTVARLYKGFATYIGKEFTVPRYTISRELPFIPTEEELELLIASGTNKTATLLQLLKETGARIGEALATKWTDVDHKRRTIYIHAEKGCNDRILPISTALIEMLNQIPKTNEKVFQATPKGMRTTYNSLRRRAAQRFSNPRLNKIHFHTFRHWKATITYHKVRDIYEVKAILGHKSVVSTEIYITIEKSIYLNQTDEWTTTVTHNIDEETKAISTGFELVRAVNETTAIYRKRK